MISNPSTISRIKKLKELRIENIPDRETNISSPKEYFSAECEYNHALSSDGNHLRANLGKGKTLYARGEKEEAKKIFSKISGNL